MTVLEWISSPVEQGVDRGVLYLPFEQGIPWLGLTEVVDNESSSTTTLYFDGAPYLVASTDDSYSGSISAITYPEQFERCESGPHSMFGFSYREDLGDNYLIHLIWNARAVPSARTHRTRADDLSIDPFTWDISTVESSLSNARGASHMVIDTNYTPPQTLATIEGMLYGSGSTNSYLPSPQDILDLFTIHSLVKITDNGDGTWTARGDEQWIKNLGNGVVQIESGGIEFINQDTYTITSW